MTNQLLQFLGFPDLRRRFLLPERSEPSPDIGELIRIIAEKTGSVEFKADVPDNAKGTWWIDVFAAGGRMTVTWHSSRGYGFFIEDGVGFGDRPHEYFPDVQTAGKLAGLAFESHFSSKGTLPFDLTA